MTEIKKRNHPIVFNLYDPSKMGMHWEGEEISYEDVDGKSRVILRPRDVWLEPGNIFNIFPQGREERKKEFKMLVEKGCRIPIKNTQHRDIVIYIPDKPENLPKELRETWVGQAMELYMKFEQAGYKVAELLNKKGYTEDEIKDMVASGQFNEVFMQSTERLVKGIVSAQLQRQPMPAPQDKEKPIN